MINLRIKHQNEIINGSRYAAKFDYVMHDFFIDKFYKNLKDKNCLEMGCYHGEMTKKLSKICRNVTAIDIDEICIKESKKNCKKITNVNFIQSSFLEYENYEKYDVIFFSHSLEHVKNHKKLLNHINKKINHKQELITIVPNGSSLSRKIAVKMGIISSALTVTDFEKKIGHHRTYDLEKLCNTLNEAGMKVVSSGGILPKIFSNNQFDKCIEKNIIDLNFLNALYKLSDEYTSLCASIYAICKKGK